LEINETYSYACAILLKKPNSWINDNNISSKENSDAGVDNGGISVINVGNYFRHSRERGHNKLGGCSTHDVYK